MHISVPLLQSKQNVAELWAKRQAHVWMASHVVQQVRWNAHPTWRGFDTVALLLEGDMVVRSYGELATGQFVRLLQFVDGPSAAARKVRASKKIPSAPHTSHASDTLTSWQVQWRCQEVLCFDRYGSCHAGCDPYLSTDQSDGLRCRWLLCAQVFGMPVVTIMPLFLCT